LFNLNKIENVYLAVGPTDLRKSIDGLSMIHGIVVIVQSIQRGR